MKSRDLAAVLLVGFSMSVGFFAYRTWQPSVAPDYRITAHTRPLSAPLAAASDTPPGKHLYLRHRFELTEPPLQAWLQLIGHDRLELFVNGKKAGLSSRGSPHRHVGIATDITSLLRPGTNSIAVHVGQTVIDRPPAVAITGRCLLPSGNAMSLDYRNDWRTSPVYERKGRFWYATEFDDSQWPAAAVGETVAWRAQVEMPPRSLTVPRQSQWISPSGATAGTAAFAQKFDLPGDPQSGWLRIVTNGSYRLAVNGWTIATDSLTLGNASPGRVVEQTLDLSSVLRRGKNCVAIMVTSPAATPRIRADLETICRNGNSTYVATDDAWRFCHGQPPDWQHPALEQEALWQPVHADMGYQRILPWQTPRELGELRPAEGFYLWQAAKWVGISLGLLLLTGGGCRLVTRLLAHLLPTTPTNRIQLLPYLALLPSTAITLVLGLATYDTAYVGMDFYQPVWLLGLLLLVVVQWLAILLRCTFPSRTSPTTRQTGLFGKLAYNHTGRANFSGQHRFHWQSRAVVFYLLLLVLVGGWLRVRNLTAEPIHHDEVGAYMFTMAILDTGLPGGQVTEDLPYGYCATSELVYYANVPFALLFDDPRLVLRVPAVCWSLATLLLLYWVGRRWFGLPTALFAATLYTFAPHVIAISNFGRYLSQLQFFALLTVYLFYQAVATSGRVRRSTYLWAVLSFMGMYLSWEGSGLLGVGLAVAILFQRRHSLRPLFTDPWVYAISLLVLIVALLQNAHRLDEQTQRLWYGQGISSLSLKMMWRYPFFDPAFYFLQTSWMRGALLPMLGLVGGVAMAVQHRHRYPLRFLLLSLGTNALLMSAFLPLRTNRYAYHLTPLVLLVVSVVFVVMAQQVARSVRPTGLLRWPTTYARGLAGTFVVTTLILLSGYAVHPTELKAFAARALDPGQFRIPHWDGPIAYLRGHVRPGDVVIANFPHAANFLMQQEKDDPAHADWQVDYWLQSTLIVQATLGDERTEPLDRRSGAAMLAHLEQLQHLLARHPRVWYCTTRYGHSRNNDRVVSQYLRQHMDVRYEDFVTTVMLRSDNHRPANIRQQEESEGQLASEYYLR